MIGRELDRAPSAIPSRIFNEIVDPGNASRPPHRRTERKPRRDHPSPGHHGAGHRHLERSRRQSRTTAKKPGIPEQRIGPFYGAQTGTQGSPTPAAARNGFTNEDRVGLERRFDEHSNFGLIPRNHRPLLAGDGIDIPYSKLASGSLRHATPFRSLITIPYDSALSPAEEHQFPARKDPRLLPPKPSKPSRSASGLRIVRAIDESLALRDYASSWGKAV